VLEGGKGEIDPPLPMMGVTCERNNGDCRSQRINDPGDLRDVSMIKRIRDVGERTIHS